MVFWVKSHGYFQSMFFLSHMELECIPSSVYSTHIVVIWTRGRLYLLSYKFPSPELGSSVAWFFLLNILWLLKPSKQFHLDFCASHKDFILFHFLFLGISPPIFHLSLHSAFIDLICTVCLLVFLMAKSNLIWPWLLFSNLLFCVSSSKDAHSIPEPFPFYTHQLFTTSVSFGMCMWHDTTSLHIACLSSRGNCLVLLDLFLYVRVFPWLKICLFHSLNPFRFWYTSYWDVVASSAFVMLKYI